MTKALLNRGVNILCILSTHICNKKEWELLSEINSNFQLIFLPTYTNNLGFIQDIFNKKPYRYAIKQIKNFHPDAIYLPMISLNARKLVFALKDIPLVTTIHDYSQHPGMKNPIKGYIFNRIERISDKFVVLTEKYASLLSKKYSVSLDNIIHIPHANFTYYNIDGKTPSFNIKKRILFFGRISKYKGISVLLKSFEILSRSMPDLQLSIVGNGELANADKRIIKSNHENIELKNEWISDECVWDLFDNSDFTIIPYIEASQSGVVALSFSCGRTVVATDVGGLREQVIPAGGAIVTPGDPVALAGEILRLYQVPSYLLELNRKAYEYATNILTWDNSANSLLKLIYEAKHR